MGNIISTGNRTVDAVGRMNLTGNITPPNWYRTVLRDNGKPYLLAICILSEICYWYRPTEIRDEQTGFVTGYRKKFRDDLLQKSYQQLADQFGESKRSIKAAMDRLEEIGVIRREWRNRKFPDGGIMTNILYIGLNEDVLYTITYCLPDDDPESVNDDVTSGRKVQKSHAKESENTVTEHVTKFCKTNTEITSEITSENSVLSISIERCDEIDEIRGIIRKNVDYDILTERYPSDKGVVDELIDIMTEVIVVESDVVIGGVEVPYELVRSRFEKFNYTHMEYVLHSLDCNTTKVRNVKKYLLATLFNAPVTIGNYYGMEVRHDMSVNDTVPDTDL